MIILAGVGVLILLLFCIPLEIMFRFEAGGRPGFRLWLLWGFGLIKTELGGSKTPRGEGTTAAAKPKPGKRRAATSSLLQILRTRGLSRQLRDLVMNTLRCVRMRQFEANLRVGLDDPADTGFLFAIIGPAVVWLSAFWHHQITVVPSFEEGMVLEGDVSGSVHLRPIQLMPPLLRFAFSPPIWRALKDKAFSTWRQQT